MVCVNEAITFGIKSESKSLIFFTVNCHSTFTFNFIFIQLKMLSNSLVHLPYDQ